MISESPIYFKTPTTLKDEFDIICRNSKSSKTQYLNSFIRKFVNEIKREEPELLKSNDRKGKSEWLSSKKEQPTDVFAGMWGR